MPLPFTRPSLTKDLEARYATQPAGESFQVKDRLGPPGTVPAAGTTMPVYSHLAQMFQIPADFLVKEMEGITQFKDAINANNGGPSTSLQLSVYIKGLDNRRYRP